MIRDKTIFVLGAGASKPYGYFTGAELRSNICKRLASMNSDIYGLLRFAGGDPDLAEEFGKAFHFSKVESIDSFVAKNKKYERIAKAMIAYELLPHENPGNLSDDSRRCW